MRKAVLVLALLAVACSKKNAGSGDGGTEPSGKEAAAGPLNATLVAHMKSLAEGCTSVNVEYGQATGCKDGLESAIRKYVTDTKPADFITTLATLAQKKDDPKVGAVAVETIYAQFDYLGEAGKKANATPAAVELILAAYKDSTGPRGVRLGKPAAQLATLAKENDKLFATIAANTGPTSQNEAYLNSLVYGRLDAFPKLKEVAATKPGNATAALDAIRRVPKATDAEKAAMCPWAKGFLGNADLKVAASAGNDMVWCRGEYVDALVTEAEKRLKDKQYKDPFAPVMREPCFEFAGKLTPAAADVAQCDRVYTFLEKASNDPGVDDATRGLALWNIYYQRRDATTMKVMRKYEKSPNKEVAKRAGEAIKSLTETYKIK